MIAAVPAGAGGISGIDDVPDGLYYTDPATWAYTNGITVGIRPGCFGPLDQLTRGDAATFLFRLDRYLGNNPTGQEHPFVDVYKSYQQEPVAWLWGSGLTTGTAPKRFEADRVISRGDYATLLWRYAGRPIVDKGRGTTVSPHRYQDDAILWMNSAGLTVNRYSFLADAPITRAQAATFLYRYVGSPAVTTLSLPTCERSLFGALVAFGMTPQEATCSVPILSPFSIREITEAVTNYFTASPQITSAFYDLVIQGCISIDRGLDFINRPR